MNEGMDYGACLHNVWVHIGSVRMANDDDSHYCQQFDTREEVEAFVNELRTAAYAAFGPTTVVRV